MLPPATLGRSALTVSTIGAGCWSWGDSEFWQFDPRNDLEAAAEAFRTAVASGIRLFDTAESYGWGKSEKILGALLRRSPTPVVTATKYAPLAGRGGPAALDRAIAGSLRRLGIDVIDLYQIHWPDRAELPIEPAMAVLARAVADGRIRAIGVSNFSAYELREAHAALAAHGIPLATHQIRYSLLHREPESNGVLDACTELGITVLAYSPLEQGLLAGRYSASALPSDGRRKTPWFEPSAVDDAAGVIATVKSVAERHRCSAATVALAWLMARGAIPLAGIRNATQASEAARAASLVLDANDLTLLDHVSATRRAAA